jgi:DNA-binding NarL/FixJ family response regulator
MDSALKRRVVLVEDEPLLASLMGQVLTDHGFNVRVCMSEEEGRDALEAFDPDAALIDVHLGSSPSGLYLAHAITRTHPHVGVLLLSRYEDLSAAGLDGFALPDGCAFLRKDQITDRQILLDAIDGVLRGSPLPKDGDDAGRLANLTRIQLSVLRLAALGLSNTAIAARRGSSERSVQRLLRSVYEALDISDDEETNQRVEAVLLYVSAAGLPADRREDEL